MLFLNTCVTDNNPTGLSEGEASGRHLAWKLRVNYRQEAPDRLHHWVVPAASETVWISVIAGDTGNPWRTSYLASENVLQAGCVWRYLFQGSYSRKPGT